MIQLMTILFAMNAHALPFMGHSVSTQKSVKKVSGECADFSGDWKGSCAYGSEAPNENTMNVIQSGCDYLNFSGDEIFVGGMQTKATTFSAGALGAMTSTSASKWNEAKSAVVINGSIFYKQLSGDQPVANISYTGTMEIKEGKLVVSGSQGDQSISCTYEKVTK